MCFPLAGRSREVSNFDFGWQFARYGLQPDCTRMEEPQGLEAPGHDDSHWRPLDLPHDWGVEGPFRTELEGNTAKLPWRAIGWYRKHFHVGKDLLGKKLYLDFDGAMANAQVWVNGRLAGGHPYGYTSFRVDITPFVAYGCENVVAVRLNTEQLGSRWYPGAGIYRHVRLVSTERVHVDHWGVFVRTPQVNVEEASALVRVDIENHLLKAVKGTSSVEILETDANDRIGRKVVSLRGKELQLNAGAKVTDSLLLRVKRPALWSVEHPARYVARVKVFADGKETDCNDQPFDFRTIQFSHDEGFLLNGKKMKIQGTCNHHDLGALGTAVNGTELQVDVHGMNYAVSAYGGKDLYGTFLDMPGHEHIVGYSSESSSTISSRGEYFPRKFQVTVYDTQEPGWDSLPDYEFAALERYPAICGEFVWTGFDYLGEPTPFNSDNSVLLNHAAGMTAEELEEQRKALEEMDTCLIRFSETTRPAFNGLMLAIVKPHRDQSGKLRLRVEAEGLEGASLDLTVKNNKLWQSGKSVQPQAEPQHTLKVPIRSGQRQFSNGEGVPYPQDTLQHRGRLHRNAHANLGAVIYRL